MRLDEGRDSGVETLQHLAFWINKYDHLFVHTPGMCVLYVGVEDRTPFPSGVEASIAAWLEDAEPKGDLTTAIR
jgi:hypothetical protein